MPKMKSKRGARKRYKVTANGRVKRWRAFKSHILTKKSAKRKRRLRKAALVAAPEERRARRLLLS